MDIEKISFKPNRLIHFAEMPPTAEEAALLGAETLKFRPQINSVADAHRGINATHQSAVTEMEKMQTSALERMKAFGRKRGSEKIVDSLATPSTVTSVAKLGILKRQSSEDLHTLAERAANAEQIRIGLESKKAAAEQLRQQYEKASKLLGKSRGRAVVKEIEGIQKAINEAERIRREAASQQRAIESTAGREFKNLRELEEPLRTIILAYVPTQVNEINRMINQAAKNRDGFELERIVNDLATSTTTSPRKISDSEERELMAIIKALTSSKAQKAKIFEEASYGGKRYSAEFDISVPATATAPAPVLKNATDKMQAMKIGDKIEAGYVTGPDVNYTLLERHNNNNIFVDDSGNRILINTADRTFTSHERGAPRKFPLTDKLRRLRIRNPQF